ncbi:sugar ABC transporter substrate-binding protein [Gryllotalpicola kribbensis]|uniref:Sugar ABC transporter substrate-binding protein n=2 Tax=Gryllotalpicola kribbensis TaxID=993084 RepID=A0ABP8AKD8_9MICO
MKRGFAVIAGAVVLGVALQGCSSGGDSSSGAGAVDGKGKTITVYTGVNTTYPQLQREFEKQVGDDFTKQTGATVVWQHGATANDTLTKIQTSAVSGQGPDVFDLGTTFTPTAYATGAFVTLDDADWKLVGGKDKFVPATLGISGPSDSKQIGVPYQSRPFVLAYNTKLFQDAGLTQPADTWDGLIAQAKKLTDPSKGVYGMAIDYKDALDPWKYVWTFATQLGNPFIKGAKAHLDDATVVSAYESYFGLLTDDHVTDPASVGWTAPQALAAFASGKAAILPMTTSNATPTLDKSAVKGDYKYAVMPTVPPGHSSLPSKGVGAASILSGDNLAVADFSPNKSLAFEFVNYLTSDKIQAEQYQDFGNLPVTKSAAAKLESNAPALAPVLAAGKKSYSTPFSGAWGDAQVGLLNVVTQSIPDLADGSVSETKIKSLLADAQDKVTKSLAQAPQSK